MTGSGLDDIARPRRRYDLSGRDDFGSYRSRRHRDRRSARELELAADQTSDPEMAGLLRDLAHRLSYAERGEPAPQSRASYVGQGYVRLRVGSDVHRLVRDARRQGAFVSFPTLIFRGGAVRPGQLLAVDPRRWAKQLKTDLDRAKTRLRLTGPGWSIWFLDCDYLQEEGVFLFHWHGFATGSELQAVEGLRKAGKYRSPRHRPGTVRDGVRFRVRRTRQPLYDIGYLCLYLLKETWPSQPRARNVADNRERSRPRPLPEHLLPLERLFFDRWRISQISAVRGLRVINGHLHPRH